MKKLIYLIFTSVALLTACDTTIEGLELNELITTSRDQITIANNGGEATIAVDAYCDWEVSKKNDADWVEVSKKSGKKGLSQLKITVSKNNSPSERSTTLTLSNKKYGATCKIQVKQNKGNSAYISTDTSELMFAANYETKVVEIRSNIEWATSCNAGWITLSPTTGKSGTTTMYITVSPNNQSEERTATITVKGKSNDSNIEKKITVVQKGKKNESTSYFRAGSYTWTFDLFFSETDTYPITTSTVFTQNGTFDLSEVLGSNFAGTTAIDWNIKGFMAETGLLEEKSPTMKACSYVMVNNGVAYEFLLFADRRTKEVYSSIGTCIMQENSGKEVEIKLFLGDLSSDNSLYLLSFAATSESEIYSDNEQPFLFYEYEGDLYIFAYLDDLSIAPATANSPMRVKASVGERATVVGQGTPLKVNPISLRK